MRRIGSTLAALVVVIFATGGAAHGQGTPQRFVIGFGIGALDFDQTDGLRQAAYATPNAQNQGPELFFEWYPASRLGLGIRLWQFYEADIDSYLVDLGGGLTSLVDIDTVSTLFTGMATLHLIPWVSDSGYARLGLLAGYGSGQYNLTSSLYVDGSLVDTTDVSTSSPVHEAGIYFDWGGAGFGMRLGISKLYADFGTVTVNAAPHTLNLTGTTAFLDFRWAIQ